MDFFSLTKKAKKSKAKSSNKRKRPSSKTTTATNDLLQNQLLRFSQSQPTTTTTTSKKKKKNKSKKKKKSLFNPLDPSTQYIKHPLRCPMVQQFNTFFAKLTATHSIPDAVAHVGPATGWRTISKLSVRSTTPTAPPVIGIFAPGSHNVVPLLSSPAHHPSIDKAVQITSQAARDTNIQGYNGKDHGGLSYVGTNVETRTGRVSLVLVWNASSASEVLRLNLFIAELIEKNEWHSIWNHFHKADRHNNQIYGREGSIWECVHGTKEPIAEVLSLKGRSMTPAPALRLPPNVFRQANLLGFAKIIQSIRNNWMRPRRTKCHLCLELYGGVGTIGLNLLDLVNELRCSDANPFNEACFVRTRDELHPSMSSKAVYFTKDASQMAIDGELSRNVDVLIVDPPRKGLDEEVLVEMERRDVPRPKRLIYVSCGFKAFQRDCGRLVRAGYVPVHGEGHVLFPGANHIETLCVFDDVRSGSGGSGGGSSSSNGGGGGGGKRKKKKKHH